MDHPEILFEAFVRSLQSQIRTDPVITQLRYVSGNRVEAVIQGQRLAGTISFNFETKQFALTFPCAESEMTLTFPPF